MGRLNSVERAQSGRQRHASEQPPAAERRGASGSRSGGTAAPPYSLVAAASSSRLVERAEGEHRRLPAGQRVVDAQLVVAVAQEWSATGAGRTARRVRVARGHRDRAPPAVPGRGHDAARVVERDVGRGVTRSAGGATRARRHDPRDVAAEAGRVAAGIEVDAARQVRVNHRRPEPEVEQRGDPDAVQKEAGVARVGAAHDVERRRPGDLRHAGQRAEHPQRVARRAGSGARLFAGDLDARDLGAGRAHCRSRSARRSGVASAGTAPRRRRRPGACVDVLGGVVVAGQLNLQPVRAGRDARSKRPSWSVSPAAAPSTAIVTPASGRRVLFQHPPPQHHRGDGGRGGSLGGARFGRHRAGVAGAARRIGVAGVARRRVERARIGRTSVGGDREASHGQRTGNRQEPEPGAPPNGNRHRRSWRSRPRPAPMGYVRARGKRRAPPD